MKKTTCRALRGACNKEITGVTAEEMAANSKEHALKMVHSGDQDHKKAMEEMMRLSPAEQQKWYREFLDRFDSLPEA